LSSSLSPRLRRRQIGGGGESLKKVAEEHRVNDLEKDKVINDLRASVLNQTASRNIKRFPTDFMFRLTRDEISMRISQIVTISKIKFSKRVLRSDDSFTLSLNLKPWGSRLGK
jgi:hypothetical protein